MHDEQSRQPGQTTDPEAEAWLQRHPKLSMAIAIMVFASLSCILLLVKQLSDQSMESNFQSRWAAWFKYLGTDPNKLELLEPAPFITDEHGFWVANPSAIGVNSQGFRNPEFDEPPLGRKTILFLGASYTWGYSADPIEASFVDLVRNAGYRTQNLGIPASQSFLQADIGEHYIPLLKPDVVAYMFALDNRIFYQLKLQPNHPFYYVTTAGWLNGYRADGAPLSLEDAHRYNLELVSAPRPSPSPEEAELITRDAINRIQAATDAVGATLLLFVIPINPDKDYHGVVEQAMHRFSDLELLAPPGLDRSHYVFQPDPHFNNEGHRIYADFVIEQLAARGFEATPDIQVPPYPYLTDNTVSFEEFRAHFGMDDAQAEETRRLLMDLNERFFVIYRTPPDDGGPAPLDYLITLLRSPKQDDAVAQAAFTAYAAQAQAPGSRRSYADYFLEDELHAREALMAILRPTQRYWAADFPVETLRNIRLENDPVGAFIAEAMASSDDNFGRAPLDLERLARRLSLDQEHEATLLETINDLKSARAELLRRPSHSINKTPLDHLAGLLASGRADAPILFVQFTEAHSPEEGPPSYADRMTAMEQEAAQELMAILDPAQRLLFQSMGIGSLAEIDTGFDPVGDALRIALEDRDHSESGAFEVPEDLHPAQSSPMLPAIP